VSGQGLKNIFIIINPAQRFSDLKIFLAFFWVGMQKAFIIPIRASVKLVSKWGNCVLLLSQFHLSLCVCVCVCVFLFGFCL
jgi:hypothetical protein